MRIGFDLGGTKMLAAVLDGDGGIVARCKTRTRGGDNESVYRQIVETIQCALERAEIGRDRLEAVGIAVPGPIDLDRGVVLDTPNVGISNFPLVDRLSEELGCVVLLENDVNAGLWGEYVAGAAKGMRHVVGIFPGTGIAPPVRSAISPSRRTGGGAGAATTGVLRRSPQRRRSLGISRFSP